MVLADVSTVYSLGEADSFMVEEVKVNAKSDKDAKKQISYKFI